MKPILLDFPMPIITPRLLLRPPCIGDGAAVNSAVLESLNELSAFLPWAQTAPTGEDSEEFVRQAAANWILKKNAEPHLPFFIFDRITQQFLGGTGYHHLDWNIPSVETGYWLRTSSTGKGYMTEAVNALTHYAFEQLRVKRIAITCDSANHRSRRVAERLGYCLEGTLKSNRRSLTTGELSDTMLYARYDLVGLPELIVEW